MFRGDLRVRLDRIEQNQLAIIERLKIMPTTKDLTDDLAQVTDALTTLGQTVANNAKTTDDAIAVIQAELANAGVPQAALDTITTQLGAIKSANDTVAAETTKLAALIPPPAPTT